MHVWGFSCTREAGESGPSHPIVVAIYTRKLKRTCPQPRPAPRPQKVIIGAEKVAYTILGGSLIITIVLWGPRPWSNCEGPRE